MDKFIFITTCGDIKNPESFEREMPLYEMYTGGVYSLRAELMYQFVDRFYISSLLHFGIVRDDFVGSGYDAPTTGLKQRMKEKDFARIIESYLTKDIPEYLLTSIRYTFSEMLSTMKPLNKYFQIKML